MADRYLREALLSSERYNGVSLDARDLYLRLLLLVDDYGVYDARENIIAQKGYPTRRDEPLPLAELQTSGLIIRFSNAGRIYLAITQWGESLRGRRKFPAPPICNDLAEVKYRGKYGQQMNWRNPQGADPVSQLIDVQGRTVIPQPPEWRRVETDWMPNGTAYQYVPPAPTQSRSVVTTSHGSPSRPAVTTDMPADTASQHGSQQLSESLSLQPQSPSQLQASPPGASHGTPSLQAATTPTANGKIRLRDDGQWEGLGEAQRLRWQGMFATMSIPDQLDRAGAWLLAHPEERQAYERDGEQEQFLIRWLLREARAAEAPH